MLSQLTRGRSVGLHIQAVVGIAVVAGGVVVLALSGRSSELLDVVADDAEVWSGGRVFLPAALHDRLEPTGRKTHALQPIRVSRQTEIIYSFRVNPNKTSSHETAATFHSLDAFYRAMLCIRGTSHGPVSVTLRLCPSVSVTSRCCIKTAKRRITKTTPHDIPGNLVF